MTIAVVQRHGFSNVIGTSGTRTTTLPSAPVAGNLLLVNMGCTGFGWAPTDAGFQLLWDVSSDNLAITKLFAKIATGGEGTSFVVSANGIVGIVAFDFIELSGDFGSDAAAALESAEFLYNSPAAAVTSIAFPTVVAGAGSFVSAFTQLRSNVTDTDAGTWPNGFTGWSGARTLSGTKLSAGASETTTLTVSGSVLNNYHSGIIYSIAETGQTGPALSLPEVFSPTLDGFSFRFTTDTGNGTAIWAAYATEAARNASTVASIQAEIATPVTSLARGTFAVATAGVQTVAAVTGLGAAQTRYVGVFHDGDVTA